MKYLFSVLFFSVVLLNSGCENVECTDVFLGDFNIDNGTRAFFPYQENNTLIFKNQDGDELSFTNIAWFEDNNSIVSFYDCGGVTRNIIYTGDIASYRFESELFDIIMSFSMTYVEEGDPKGENIVDLVTFQLVHPNEGFFATLSMVPFTRGVTNFSGLEDFETFENLSLNGNFYAQGFRSVEAKPENLVDLYVSATEGVIGFTDTDGNTWVFDRIE